MFFVIHLHAGPVINTLPPIIDPDPMLTCDLMDGRDAFLTLARDKHWEFSSLRRCKWSTMCMLVELHNQGQDRFVYTCNECKHHVETRWHCTVCEVRNNCISQEMFFFKSVYISGFNIQIATSSYCDLFVFRTMTYALTATTLRATSIKW